MDEKMKNLIDKIVITINNNDNIKQNFNDTLNMAKEIASLSVISETIHSQNTSITEKPNMYMVNMIISVLNKNKIAPGKAIEILYLIQTYIMERYPELKDVAEYLIKQIEVK